jgi:hypothetical protein
LEFIWNLVFGIYLVLVPIAIGIGTWFFPAEGRVKTSAMRKFYVVYFALSISIASSAQKPSSFNAAEVNLGNLYRLSNAKTRSISPENPTGEPGKGGMATLENGTARNNAKDLGQGWKVNPFINIEAGQTTTLAEISGPRRHSTYMDDPNWKLAIFNSSFLLG